MPSLPSPPAGRAGSAWQSWFRQNAAAARSHRNGADLMGRDWSKQTGSGKLNSFECSSAVELLQLMEATRPF
jgi:hypothetical protein